MLPLKDLLDILDKNKVKYNKKFKNIETICLTSARCEDFAKETMGYIEELIKIGVNIGFNIVKKGIYQLTDLAVETSKPKAKMKLEGMIDERQDIMDKINRIKDESKEIDVRESLLKFIDNSINCAYALVERTNDNNEKTTLENSASLLEELKRIVENQVFDVSSKEAAKNSNLIFFEIKPWRDRAADHLIAPFMNNTLVNAQSVAMQWAALKDEVNKNNRATEEDLVKIKDDKLSEILKAEKTKEECLAFFEKLNSFKDRLEERISNGYRDQREKIDVLSKEIDELTGELAKVQEQYKSGKITPNDANSQAIYIGEQIAGKQEERDKCKEEIYNIRETYRNRLDLVMRFKEFEEIYNQFNDSAYMINRIFSNVDFNLFLGVLDMNAPSEMIASTQCFYKMVMEEVQRTRIDIAPIEPPHNIRPRLNSETIKEVNVDIEIEESLNAVFDEFLTNVGITKEDIDIKDKK